MGMTQRSLLVDINSMTRTDSVFIDRHQILLQWLCDHGASVRPNLGLPPQTCDDLRGPGGCDPYQPLRPQRFLGAAQYLWRPCLDKRAISQASGGLAALA